MRHMAWKLAGTSWIVSTAVAIKAVPEVSVVVGACPDGVDDLTIGKDPYQRSKIDFAGGRRDARSSLGEATADRSRSRVPGFWTFSVGVDSSSLDAFAVPNRTEGSSQGSGRSGETQFEFFPITGHRLPMTWE